MLCYVTDTRALAGRHEAREAIRRAVSAGVDWIQIREKNPDTRALTELVREAVSLAGSGTQRSGTCILVNDRLDVAIAAGAAGVHLGERALPREAVAAWRRGAGRTEFRIGASCHSLEAALAAEQRGADYIFFGPVFATPAKTKFGAPQGIDRLREVCRAVQIPVLAIGGITIENANSCVAAGAAGIAAIRLFQESADVAAVVEHLLR